MSPPRRVPESDPHTPAVRSGITKVAGVVFLRYSGEVHGIDVPQLQSAFARALDGANGVLLLDLEDASFPDPGALSAVVEWLHRADRAGYTVGVVSSSSRVRSAVAAAGSDVLPARPSLVDVAIAASIDSAPQKGGPDG